MSWSDCSRLRPPIVVVVTKKMRADVSIRTGSALRLATGITAAKARNFLDCHYGTTEVVP